MKVSGKLTDWFVILNFYHPIRRIEIMDLPKGDHVLSINDTKIDKTNQIKNNSYDFENVIFLRDSENTSLDLWVDVTQGKMWDYLSRDELEKRKYIDFSLPIIRSVKLYIDREMQPYTMPPFVRVNAFGFRIINTPPIRQNVENTYVAHVSFVYDFELKGKISQIKYEREKEFVLIIDKYIEFESDDYGVLDFGMLNPATHVELRNRKLSKTEIDHRNDINKSKTGNYLDFDNVTSAQIRVKLYDEEFCVKVDKFTKTKN